MLVYNECHSVGVQLVAVDAASALNNNMMTSLQAVSHNDLNFNKNADYQQLSSHGEPRGIFDSNCECLHRYHFFAVMVLL